MAAITINIILYLLSSEMGKYDIVPIHLHGSIQYVRCTIYNKSQYLMLDFNGMYSKMVRSSIELYNEKGWDNKNVTFDINNKYHFGKGPMCLLRFNSRWHYIAFQTTARLTDGEKDVNNKMFCGSLGMDFMRNHKVIIDYRYGIIKIPKTKFYYDSIR